MESFTKGLAVDETATTTIPSGSYIRYIHISGPSGGRVSVYCGSASTPNLIANFQSLTYPIEIPVDQQCNNDVVVLTTGMGYANLSIGYDAGSSGGDYFDWTEQNGITNIFFGIVLFFAAMWFMVWFFRGKTVA